MRDFAEYDQHTEAMIAWLIDRWEEDEVLARARSRPSLPFALFDLWASRDAVHLYRAAASRVLSRTGGPGWFWASLARYHAFGLRMAAGALFDRAGFDPAWKRAPRRR